MEHVFDVVTVGADDERRIAGGVVLRAQTGRTVVLAARLKRRAMESIDLPAAFGREGDVEMRRHFPGLEQLR